MSRNKSCFNVRWNQTLTLLKKNFLVLMRNKTSTAVQLLIPIVFVAFLFVLKYAIRSSFQRQEAFRDDPVGVLYNISQIPRCIIGPENDHCYTIGYSPNDTDIAHELISWIVMKHNIPDDEVISFRNEMEANQFILENPNITQAVYHIQFDYGCDYLTNKYDIDLCHSQVHTKDEIIGVKYAVQTNLTITRFRNQIIDLNTYLRAPMIKAMDESLLTSFSGKETVLDLSVKTFPHMLIEFFDIISGLGTYFFFGALMFNFVIQIGQIVIEKELNLRESLRVMGMVDFSYWASWALSNTFMNIISALLLIAAGSAFQFDFFLKNDFFSYLYLFILFAIAMVPMAIFVSVLISSTSTSTTLGFAIFLVGSIIQAFTQLIFRKSTHLALRIVFALLPFAVFAQGLNVLSEFTSESTPGRKGITWEETLNYGDFTVEDCYWWLALDTLIYGLLAIWLDNIVYSKRNVFFFLMPSYWRGKKYKSTNTTPYIDEYEGEHIDVINERKKILDGDTEDSSIIISGLVKTYKKKQCFCIDSKKHEFKAVKGIYLTIQDDTLLCLLGHNGAGKTTTIGMLTGLHSSTQGDALIFGNSIIDGMGEIRKNMGVCPQHDILWKQLTAGEHIELFCGIKNLGGDIKLEIEQRLSDVGLLGVKNVTADQFSGGMKRRLSVAIAMVGDPKFLILDEPTTGMDTVARRQVWNLIERIKKGRVTLLTTHSMEEADVLGDKTAIMKEGRIAAIGDNLHLKNEYGSGYTISIVSQSPENLPKITKYILKYFKTLTKQKKKEFKEKGITNIPKPSLISERNSTAKFKLPNEYESSLPELFEELESRKDELGIKDMQLSMTTLEDVFLKVADEESVKEKKEEKKSNRKKFIFIGLAIAFALLAIILAIALPLSLRKEDEIIAPERSSEPLPLIPTGTFSDDFSTGIQVSDVHSTFALVSLQAPLTELTLHLYKGVGNRWEEENSFNLVSSDDSFFINITDLDPDTPYSVYATNAADETSYATRFRTALEGTNNRIVRFGAASSFGLTNKPWDMLSHAANERLDLFILVGENIYGRGESGAYMTKWNEFLSTSGMAQLTNTTSFIATINDQDFEEGWYPDSPDTINRYEEALESFKRVFPFNEGPGDGVGISKLWRHIKYSNTIDFFVLDTRSERTEDKIISDAQMNWIKDSLVSSEALYKFIITPSPLTNPELFQMTFPGSWMDYTEQRNEIMNHITDNNIKGVIFISGGVGFGAVGRANPSPEDPNSKWSTYNVTEVLVGPTGSFINPQMILNPTTSFTPPQFEIIIDTWSYTLFTVDPLNKVLKLEFINDKGFNIGDVELEYEGWVEK